MAQIYPKLNDVQLDSLPSAAEAKVYKTLRNDLDDSFLIIHGKSFLAPRLNGGRVDGEADFAVFSAQHGMLIIEVKGGGVSFDGETGWESIDRNGNRYSIKDPVAQAKNQKFAFLNQMKSHNLFSSFRKNISVGHAVFFPDIVGHESFNLTECPHQIIGSASDLNHIRSWIFSVFDYWLGSGFEPLGNDGLDFVKKVFCSRVEVKPTLSEVLKAEEQVRLILTEQQSAILRTLGRKTRAGIVGAAGTGKTVLAFEKVKALAGAGKKVLFLCFNKALAATLARKCETLPGVMTCTFHQFCRYVVKDCLKDHGFDAVFKAKSEYPKHDYWSTQLPLAAYYAIEVLGEKYLFDAIVVDEGQDFADEYWLPVESALADSESSWFYVFYDENQRMYSKVSSFPIPDSDTYLLTKNCRNSTAIHELSYKYYEGTHVDDSGIEGIDPVFLEAKSLDRQAAKISQEITSLITDGSVDPCDVAVLIPSTGYKDDFYKLLTIQPLPKGASWSVEEHFVDSAVLVDTVKRFKGLERQVIFLWVDEFDAVDDAQLYVGISRAKSVIYIVGNSSLISSVEA